MMPAVSPDLTMTPTGDAGASSKLASDADVMTAFEGDRPGELAISSDAGSVLQHRQFLRCSTAGTTSPELVMMATGSGQTGQSVHLKEASRETKNIAVIRMAESGPG